MSTMTEEQRLLAEVEAGLAAGDDVFGDNDVNNNDDLNDDGQLDQGQGQADHKERPTEAQDDAPTDAPTDAPKYAAEVPSDYASQRGELLKAKAEAMSQVLEGAIDAEEFAAEEARIANALEELTVQRVRAETLLEANRQQQAQAQQADLMRLVAEAKSVIDYATDAKAQRQFDTALKTLAADTDNATLTHGQLIREAHKVVMALRGIVAPSAQSAQAPRRGANAPVPPSLRSLPAAATPNANGDAIEQLSRLTGQAYEEAFARLTPSQQAQLLS